jgi:hypothetical protein
MNGFLDQTVRSIEVGTADPFAIVALDAYNLVVHLVGAGFLMALVLLVPAALETAARSFHWNHTHSGFDPRGSLACVAKSRAGLRDGT